jgi:hypothetical protein
MYVYTCKLIFKSYKPLKLEEGMYFLLRKEDEMVIHQLDKVPYNEESYLQEAGYPVEPYIIHQGNPNVDEDYVIAQPHEIGWWDHGDDVDDLYEISIKEINNIFRLDGWVDVEVEEYGDDVDRPIPILAEGRVIMSYIDVDDEEEFEYNDEEYTPPSNDEWENQFLNPNHDERYDED